MGLAFCIDAVPFVLALLRHGARLRRHQVVAALESVIDGVSFFHHHPLLLVWVVDGLFGEVLVDYVRVVGTAAHELAARPVAASNCRVVFRRCAGEPICARLVLSRAHLPLLDRRWRRRFGGTWRRRGRARRRRWARRRRRRRRRIKGAYSVVAAIRVVALVRAAARLSNGKVDALLEGDFHNQIIDIVDRLNRLRASAAAAAVVRLRRSGNACGPG